MIKEMNLFNNIRNNKYLLFELLLIITFNLI